jgi:orotidine-5'-phosphate decarboxylase
MDTSRSSKYSAKPIPSAERLIFALDVPSVAEARNLVDRLGDSVGFYKVGLQLFMAAGSYEFIDWVAARGKKIFLDVKLHDIPETVKLAVAQLTDRNITFVTIHAVDRLLEAAVKVKGSVKILAVTLLTSVEQRDLDEDLGFRCNLERLVLSRAKRAVQIGCEGVISSGLEAGILREELGADFLIVSPGIRPSENRPADDQKRVVTVRDAFQNGADYIVIGRPIRDSADPRAKAAEIQREIAALFAPSAVSR